MIQIYFYLDFCVVFGYSKWFSSMSACKIAWVSGVMYNLRSTSYHYTYIYRRLDRKRIRLHQILVHPIRFEYFFRQLNREVSPLSLFYLIVSIQIVSSQNSISLEPSLIFCWNNSIRTMRFKIAKNSSNLRTTLPEIHSPSFLMNFKIFVNL